MSKHLNQCAHNEDFLSLLEDKFPKIYNDWKCTVVFYAATHLIRGYALQVHGKSIDESHTAVFEFLEQNHGKKSKIYKGFEILYRNSSDCRYQGFAKDRNGFEYFAMLKFNESLTRYKQHVKKTILAQGVKLPDFAT